MYHMNRDLKANGFSLAGLSVTHMEMNAEEKKKKNTHVPVRREA
jgi:hypothetical protein